MITENVILELEKFAPSDEPENVGRLYEIFDQLQALPPALRSPVIPAILGLIERYPEAELGSPGPLVHELEAIPGYESYLRDSVVRQPAYLSIWMVNRILNSELSADERSGWLQVLLSVLTHPLASADLRQEASEFLEHQGQ
ncbi:hypothetical protein ACXZ1M_00565 [Duganella sp. PWIR1]